MQTEMTLLEVMEREDAAAQAARRDAEVERWSNWGRGLGLLTLDDIQRNARPLWQWDDYAI